MKKLLLSLLCLGMLLGCSNNSNEKKQEEKPQEESKTTEQDQTTQYQDELEKYKNYKSGTYQVGKDIDAGEYCLFSNSIDDLSNSYEVRKNEFSDGDDYIYSESNFSNSYITLKKGDYIEIDGATMFNVNDMPAINTDFPYVTIKVGKDIEPGNYIIKPLKEEDYVFLGGGVYFKIMNPFGENGDRNDIVTNGLDFTVDKKVKLKNNQYLMIQNCTFEKVK